MKKGICIVFVLFVFGCGAMQDVETNFSEQQSALIQSWHMQTCSEPLENCIEKLKLYTDQLKNAKNGTLASLLTSSETMLRRVFGFLNMVSLDDSELDVLDDDVLDKLYADASSCVEHFDRIFRQRQARGDFSELENVKQKVEVLLTRGG